VELIGIGGGYARRPQEPPPQVVGLATHLRREVALVGDRPELELICSPLRHYPSRLGRHREGGVLDQYAFPVAHDLRRAIHAPPLITVEFPRSLVVVWLAADRRTPTNPPGGRLPTGPLKVLSSR